MSKSIALCPGCGTPMDGAEEHVLEGYDCILRQRAAERKAREKAEKELQYERESWAKDILLERTEKAEAEVATLKARAKDLEDMLNETVAWINAECVKGPDELPIGYVVPGCRGVVELIGELLDGTREAAEAAKGSK